MSSLIAVTGAAGFIGSVMISALNQAGYENIVAVDDLGSGQKFKNLRAKSYRSVISPERFLEALTAKSIKPNIVIHLGAITDTAESDVDLMLQRNTEYTTRLARWCLENGSRFVYASSASVYGDGKRGFSDADSLTPQLMPLNGYGYTKWLFDAIAIREEWSNHIVGLRFFNVFGPNEYHKGRMASVVWHAYNQIKSTAQLQLFRSHVPEYADGGQMRDFVYVKDVVACMLWFMHNADVNGIYNLGTGKARSFADLAGSVFAAMNVTPEIEFVDTPENIRNAYQYFTEADLSKLRAIGYTAPFTSLEDATADYIKQYLTDSNPYC